MLIAQISDCHITEPGVRPYRYMDTAERLSRTVRVLSTLQPRPDCVLATGDLTQSGTRSEYAILRGMLDRLGIAVFPCMGNHDVRDAFRTAFNHVSDQIGRPDFIQYVVDSYALRLIMLDTVQAGCDEPLFCASRLDWLKGELARSDQPVLIAMHHPPFESGVRWVDANEPTWSSELASVLTGCGRVRGIVCGHVHRSTHRSWRGIPVSTAPAVAPQVALNLASCWEPAYSMESPGFLLHRWDGAQLVTYTVSVDGFAEIIRI